MCYILLLWFYGTHFLIRMGYDFCFLHFFMVVCLTLYIKAAVFVVSQKQVKVAGVIV